MPLNHINLEVLNRIPLDGVDTHIVCSGCSALCCRAGTVLPLDEHEARFLQESSEVELLQDESLRRKIAKGIMSAANVGSFGRKREHRDLYRLKTDCGNLDRDEASGRLICKAYYDERRPRACDEFKMGGYACALIQLRRLSSIPQASDT